MGVAYTKELPLGKGAEIRGGSSSGSILVSCYYNTLCAN